MKGLHGAEDERAYKKITWIHIGEEFTFIPSLIGFPWKQNFLVGEEAGESRLQYKKESYIKGIKRSRVKILSGRKMDKRDKYVSVFS